MVNDEETIIYISKPNLYLQGNSLDVGSHQMKFLDMISSPHQILCHDFNSGLRDGFALKVVAMSS